MEAIARPLRRLVAALQWFVVAEELRLLQVVVSEDLRIVALEHVAAEEHDAANRRPFFVLEAPVDDDAGWAVRSEELRADMAELTELLARDEDPLVLAPMPAPPSGPRGAALFAAELQAALGCLKAPLTGLVLVLAPAWLRARSPFLDELRALIEAPALAQIRWILVEPDCDHAAALVAALGRRAERVEVRVDAEEARRDLEAMGGTPGVVGPRQPPPARKGAPPPLAPEELKRSAEGVPSGLLDPASAARFRERVMGAAREMSAGRSGEAVDRLREAAELARGGGMAKEALVLELVQGAHVLQAGGADAAVRVFDETGRRALAGGFPDVAVQAQLATAAALLVQKKPDRAAEAYARAGRMGADAGAPALAIEAYRTCGQLLLSLGQEREAARVWNEALALGGELPAGQRSSASAAEAARALAWLCRKHALTAQAASLEAQARALEAGEDGPASSGGES